MSVNIIIDIVTITITIQNSYLTGSVMVMIAGRCWENR